MGRNSVRHVGVGVTVLLVGLVCRLGAAEPTLAATAASPAAAGVSAVAAGGFKILYPFDETVFPPDLAPPTFRWPPVTPGCDTWRVTLRFRDELAPVQVTVSEPRWTPAAPLWESIKQRSREKPAQVTVSGFRRSAPDETVCQSGLSIMTSQDEVGAPIFYRDVNLPFVEAVKDPSDIRWRFGVISEPQAPRIVLGNMPVCGNCHSFSADGKTLGMDVDYANSKASYVIAPTAPEMALAPKDIITWDAYRPEDGELTFGLLSQVSPDGQWVVSTVKDKSVFVPMPDLAFSQLFFPIRGILALYVFCRATNYMLLRPDSELFIIPAEGGTARRLRGNLWRMNSWHSWSPNSRWLVFSSKAFSDYTQLFLTHIDADGNSAPPVLLEHFTATNRAANIPEFVNLPPGGIVKIQERFLNDYSFERAGNEFYRAGDAEHAIEKYRQTLELNPENVTAHQRLGFLLYNVKRQPTEGIEHTRAAVRIDPKNSFAQSDLGVALLNQGQPDEAIPPLLAALDSLPLTTEPQYQPQVIRLNLAKAYLKRSRFREAATHFEESVRLDAGNAEAHYLLALALACQGDIENAVEHCAKAKSLQPSIDTSVTLHELLAENYAKAARWDDAIRSAEHALEIARAAGKNDLAGRVQARLLRYRAQPATGR